MGPGGLFFFFLQSVCAVYIGSSIISSLLISELLPRKITFFFYSQRFNTSLSLYFFCVATVKEFVQYILWGVCITGGGVCGFFIFLFCLFVSLLDFH